jgi:hypothetical protein
MRLSRFLREEGYIIIDAFLTLSNPAVDRRAGEVKLCHIRLLLSGAVAYFSIAEANEKARPSLQPARALGQFGSPTHD